MHITTVLLRTVKPGPSYRRTGPSHRRTGPSHRRTGPSHRRTLEPSHRM